jgi:hypothetical protein
VDRALIYEESLKKNATKYADRKRGAQGLVLWREEMGQLKEWQWGAFHPRGHKDIPIATLKFRCRRVRYRSCVGNVREFIGDHVE